MLCVTSRIPPPRPDQRPVENFKSEPTWQCTCARTEVAGQWKGKPQKDVPVRTFIAPKDQGNFKPEPPPKKHSLCQTNHTPTLLTLVGSIDPLVGRPTESIVPTGCVLEIWKPPPCNIANVPWRTRKREQKKWTNTFGGQSLVYYMAFGGDPVFAQLNCPTAPKQQNPFSYPLILGGTNPFCYSNC